MFSLVVLAAGKGTRMKSDLPKVLHPLMGSPLLEYAVQKAGHLNPEKLIVVIGHGREEIMNRFSPENYSSDIEICWAVQEDQLGTGHAAAIGIAAIEESADDQPVLIMNGDLPLLRNETILRMLEAHNSGNMDVTVLTCAKKNPSGFGRIVRGSPGSQGEAPLVAIVEENDADDQTKAINEVNVGTYLIGAGAFKRCYEATGTENDQGERYLTDVIVEAVRSGLKVATVPVDDETETAQVNSQAELAYAQGLMRDELVVNHLEAGVVIDDPSSTFIENNVTISAGARIHPFCVIRSGTTIGQGCEVGPFAHLRPGADLESGAKVGNFVEIKNSRLGSGSKANHLSYIGDGDVGEKVNIGAGTIFANYDGKNKNKVTIQDGAFIGSGSVLVAPVTIGKDSMTGAGSVVLKGRDVPDGEVVVGVPARPFNQVENDDGGNCQD